MQILNTSLTIPSPFKKISVLLIFDLSPESKDESTVIRYLPGSKRHIALRQEYSLISTLRHWNLSIMASKERIVSMASSSKSLLIARDANERGSNGH